MGLCFNKCSNQHLRAAIDKVVLKYLGASRGLVVTNSPAFGTFYQTHVNDNNILCPIPGDFSLLPNSFECCPEKVARDAIRMWSEITGNLPGISVTSPMFADGYADLNPSCFGPVWSILDDYTVISKPVNDKLNKAYSSFIYLPDDFRRLNQNHQVLTIDMTCSDHHDKVLRDRASKSTSMEHVRSLCQPLPHHYMSFGANDDHFSKVPRTNAAMRASVSSGNTLQCLTLFKNEHLSIVCNCRERGSKCTADFLTTCRHFKYKQAYFNFSLEGNLFENAIRHSIRYFASINHRYDACVQNLNYMQLMTQWVKKGICGDNKPLTNALCKVGIICRSSFNGPHCSMCEMQKKQDSGIKYVKIRPMTNEDGWRHQMA